LPNVLGPAIVAATTSLGSAILVEGSLAFLGMGTPAPTPSWGSMISAGRKLVLNAPLLLWAPAAAVSVTILSFNHAGDMVRDLFDPQLRVP
jgi:ABC-type dipeptide/oligopeptide/nickel transport system permease subunit